MPYYLIQAAYTAEAWGAQLKAPEDPRDRLQALEQAFGGRLASFFYCFGDYDVLGIVEFPGNEAAAAAAFASLGRGWARAFKTTPLMTVEEGLSAMRTASGAGPPT